MGLKQKDEKKEVPAAAKKDEVAAAGKESKKSP